jgi:hypothetical protein
MSGGLPRFFFTLAGSVLLFLLLLIRPPGDAAALLVGASDFDESFARANLPGFRRRYIGELAIAIETRLGAILNRWLLVI